MKLIYPAVFKHFTDQSGGYVVEFPDLPGCVTEGKNLEQAIEMLNTFAEKNNINFSKLLQEALFSMAQAK